MFGHQRHAFLDAVIGLSLHDSCSHDFCDRRSLGRFAFEDDFPRIVSLGNHAGKVAILRHHQCPDLFLRHQVNRVIHRLFWPYLPDIMTFLIQKCFDENSTDKGWVVADFQKLRVPERIGFLKDYLPDFLVKNKQVYGILSEGIHELTEEDCLGQVTRETCPTIRRG